MDIALDEARAAALRGEVPVGAVVVDGVTGEVLAQTGNRTEERHDPTAHAEILALRAATEMRGSARIEDCDLLCDFRAMRHVCGGDFLCPDTAPLFRGL